MEAVVPEYVQSYTKYAKFKLSDFLDIFDTVTSSAFTDYVVDLSTDADVIVRAVSGGYNVIIRFASGGVYRGRTDNAVGSSDMG